VSTTLQHAIDQTLADLKALRRGMGPYPLASATKFRELQQLAQKARETPKPVPAPTAAVVSRLETPAFRAQEAAPSLATTLERYQTLDELRAAALACVKCEHLVASRTQVVFGVGNPNADIMFVGEAPGAEEDQQGEPFVGRAGQLLTKIIQAMGLSRDEVYIGNVLKCRPDMPKGSTGNRKPRAEEMETCLPWLERQIELVKPKALVALGATAVEGLLGETSSMSSLRGRWLEFRGIPVMVTYHPAYLLRNQTISEKRKVWEDMLKVMEKLDLPISEKQRRFFTSAA